MGELLCCSRGTGVRPVFEESETKGGGPSLSDPGSGRGELLEAEVGELLESGPPTGPAKE